jgi:hypothetical protein
VQRAAKALVVVFLSAALTGVACGKSPAPAAPSPTPAAPTTTENFAGTLAVGGTAFYSFSVAQYGTVNLTLASVEDSDTSTVQLGLALGRPSGTGCTTGSTVNTAAGAAAQLTGTFDPGVFCAKVFDIGNLVGPTRFGVTIAHP